MSMSSLRPAGYSRCPPLNSTADSSPRQHWSRANSSTPYTILPQPGPLPRVVVTLWRSIRHVASSGSTFLGPNRIKRTDIVSAIMTRPDDMDEDDEWGTYEPSLHRFAWPRLDELDISGCHLGDASATALLTRSSFPIVADLDISGNDLTDAAVDSLLASGLPRQLKRLVLGGNDITDVGAMALASRWPTGADDRLENLNLRFTHIGQAGQAALLRRFGGRVDLF